jgi:hypothetical protein
MRRKSWPLQPQSRLFPVVAPSDVVPREAKPEIVRALVDLLLEAMRVDVNGGRDDEPEDHV